MEYYFNTLTNHLMDELIACTRSSRGWWIKKRWRRWAHRLPARLKPTPEIICPEGMRSMDMSAYRYEVVDVPKDYAPRKRFDEWARGEANPAPPTLSRAVHIESGVWFGDVRRMGPHPREMMTFYTLHSGPSEDWSILLMKKHGLLEVLARQLCIPYKAKTREETDAFKIEHGSIIEYVAYPADQPDIEKLDRDPAMIERLFDLILVHRTQGKLLSTTVAHYDWGGGVLEYKKKRHQYQSGFLRQVFERRVGWD